MKKLLLIISILTSYPAFATCPIDASSCIAEFQPLQTMPSAPLQIPENSSSKVFSPTPPTTNLSREISPQNVRMFGPTDEDYGYNAGCQFGVCQNSGTPKSFSSSENK